MRGTLKRVAERTLRGSGIARVARSLRRGRLLVLAYHNVVPDGEAVGGDGSLHLPQREFARQLDLLRRTHDVVSLAAAAPEPPAGPSRPRAVITFDDAYQGALTAGLEELARRSLPATIFVAPAFVPGGSFWWDALADPGSRALRPELRAHALDILRGRDEAIRAWAVDQGWLVHDAPAHQLAATEEQLRRASATPGITLASHTWSHANLARLRGAELDDELVRPLAWLRERFADRVVPWLSYPYGLRSAEAEAAARRAGYRGALLVEGGWIPPGADPFALPRLNVPAGVSLDGFELRVSGLLSA